MRLRPVVNVTDRPKRMSRPPKQFLDDLYEIGAVNVTKVAKRPKIEKNLYEVEIVVLKKERDDNSFRGLR